MIDVELQANSLRHPEPDPAALTKVFKQLLRGLEYYSRKLPCRDIDRVAAAQEFSKFNGLLGACRVNELSGQILPLTNATFQQLFDPSKPTVLIVHPGSFDGDALVGIAAQRSAYDPGVNVIFVDSRSQDFVKTTANGKESFGVNAGWLIDGAGRVFVGSYPFTIIPNLVIDNSSDIQRRKWYQTFNVAELNDQCAYEIGTSKVKQKPFIAKFMKVPEYFSFEGKPGSTGCRSPLTESERLRVEQFLDSHSHIDEFVVKPDSESQGNGVGFYLAADREGIVQAVQACRLEFGSVVLEKRIESIPYIDEENNLHDWNLRVLATPFGIIDLEVRRGLNGGAINKCKGALVEEFSPQTLYDVYPDHTEAAAAHRQLLETLETASSRICEYVNAGFLGIDVIISQSSDGSLDPYCNEINVGRVGGLTSLGEIRSEIDWKLAAPAEFLLHLQKLLKARDISEPVIAEDSAHTTLHNSIPEDFPLYTLLDTVVNAIEGCETDQERSEVFQLTQESLLILRTLEAAPKTEIDRIGGYLLALAATEAQRAFIPELFETIPITSMTPTMVAEGLKLLSPAARFELLLQLNESDMTSHAVLETIFPAVIKEDLILAQRYLRRIEKNFGSRSSEFSTCKRLFFRASGDIKNLKRSNDELRLDIDKESDLWKKFEKMEDLLSDLLVVGDYTAITEYREIIDELSQKFDIQGDRLTLSHLTLATAYIYTGKADLAKKLLAVSSVSPTSPLVEYFEMVTDILSSVSQSRYGPAISGRFTGLINKLDDRLRLLHLRLMSSAIHQWEKNGFRVFSEISD